MDNKYIVFWLARIAECRAVTESRHRAGGDSDLSWELRKLWEMERRLIKDKYMYGSYQSMIRDWTHPKPNTDPYYRKKIHPMMLDRGEPKGINTAVFRMDDLLKLKETLNARNALEETNLLVEGLIHETDPTA